MIEEQNECFPNEKLTLQKIPVFNEQSISDYNKYIIGLKEAYYKRENPSTAKEDVIEFLNSIPNEPDFIYFIDILFSKLTNNL